MPRATQSASSSSLLPREGGAGGRAQNTASCCYRDCAAMHGCFFVVIIIVGGSVGGECPRRQLPGVEAAMKEAAAAVIMTCFVVVGLWGMWCFWFVSHVNY